MPFSCFDHQGNRRQEHIAVKPSQTLTYSMTLLKTISNMSSILNFRMLDMHVVVGIHLKPTSNTTHARPSMTHTTSSCGQVQWGW